MLLPPGKKLYFLSDFHLGSPSREASLVREKRIVQFLTEAQEDATAIYLLGDTFDFWYEYRTVVPRGYTRLFGKLAELTDSGIQVHHFVGNHDMWMRDYFQQELGIPVYFEAQDVEWNGTRFHLAHGDGLGPGDHGYKRLKKVFRNPLCQWLFGILHPSIGMGIANYFSTRSKKITGVQEEEQFLGPDKEWLIQYSVQKLGEHHRHYFIFGHRHLPIDYRLAPDSRYINLGDWVRYFTYAVWDGMDMVLQSYSTAENKIIRPI